MFLVTSTPSCLFNWAWLHLWYILVLQGTKKSKYHIYFLILQIKGKIKNSFIPVYGLTKPQVPKFLIHHSNTAKIVWDSFILLCILYTSVVVPFFVAFNYSKFEVVIFDTFVDLMFFIDIIITFFTTYINSAGELVVSGKLIRRNYIRGWFLLDCVAALPYSVITFTFNNSVSLS